MSQSNNDRLQLLSSKEVASLLVVNTRAFGNAAAKVSLHQATEAFTKAVEKLQQADKPLVPATSSTENKD